MVKEYTREEDRMLSELHEIFKHSDNDIYMKFPEEIRKFIETYEGQYVFKYDNDKRLNDQDILPMTKAFITYTYYPVADEETKRIIKKTCVDYEMKIRSSIKSGDELFEKKEKANIEEEKTELIKIEKETLLKRIINKIKSLFLRKDK